MDKSGDAAENRTPLSEAPLDLGRVGEPGLILRHAGHCITECREAASVLIQIRA